MSADRWPRSPILWASAALIGMSLLALATGTPLSRITQIAIYALYGAGVNFLIAYTGLVPFGASVFFGCATYAAALATLHGLANEVAGLVIATLFSLALGALLGAVILRRRGLYFSLLTLACSQLAFEIVFRWTDLTGGENGLQNVPRPWLASAPAFHAFTLVVVVAALWLMWRLAHSPFGRSLQAIRDNEQRVSSLGYDTFRLKMVGFTAAGGFIGLAGALLAFLLQGAYANNLAWQHAGDALLMAVLGGVHHFLGPLWGATAFILLEDRLSALTENWWLVFAPILIVFVLVAPEGLHGLARRLSGRHDWTLVRKGIPNRPDRIRPFEAGVAKLDPDWPILTVRGLRKQFGSLVVAQDIDLEVFPYKLHSFIGPNGAGKTTFFNMLSGIIPANAGAIHFRGTDITGLPLHKRIRLGLGRSFQIVSVFPNLTAFENVRVAVQARHPRQNDLWRDAYELNEINQQTWSLLAAVGLDRRAADLCANLSHGERRLLEIAVTLATDAQLLLLDEPLAGLAEADREVVSRLVRQLAETHAVLLVEHDLDRVVALSDRITVLHQGRLIADGKPAEVVENPAVVGAYLGARATEHARLPSTAAVANLRRPPKPLLRLERVVAGYGGSRILDGIEMTVFEGEAVALLGRNGVGKTTILRAITGTVPIVEGMISLDGKPINGEAPYAINRRGISIVPEGRRLFPNLTVLENLRVAARPGGATLDEVFALFPRLRERQSVRAENLSGGERQMGAIARALMAPNRLLLLDEPFEGLAPAVVKELVEAIGKLRGRMAIVLVEHHAEKVLPIVERAYVLVNGRVAFEGRSADLEADHALQAELLGVVEKARPPLENRGSA